MKKRDFELCLAVFKADHEKVDQLIAAGADVNAVGERAQLSIADKTPLWSAVNSAGQEIADYWTEFCGLVSEAFPTIQRRDHGGKRASYLAIVKMLIKAGANVDQHCHGTTPIFQAIKKCDLELVSILLSSGSNPNAESFSILSKLAKRKDRKTEMGYYGTPLHAAVEKNALEIIKALLDAGADATRTDHEGKTPLDIARDKGYTQIVDLLKHSVTSQKNGS